MNKLIERKGPRLGLIMTEGFEDTVLVGRASQWSDGIPFKEQRNIAGADKPQPIIPKDLTVGVKERVDYRGEMLRPLDEDHFLTQLDALVDAGVRGFVVSLLWSFMNPVHELRIRELIEREYNETYLGSMPVFLSSEVSPRKFEYTRTTMTILNAYLHQSMYEELIGIGQELRRGGYRNPLMMVHNTGGMASVFRSAAVHTYNGGPVAGLMGSSTLGRAYGYKNVVVTDMGGTSFDIAMVVEGSDPLLQVRPHDRPLDDRRDHPGLPVDRFGRRLDRAGRRAARQPARGRARERRLDPGAGRLRPGRARADGHRRRPGARLPEPRALPRRAAHAEPAPRRAGDPRAGGQAARDRRARGGAAHQADHRRPDGRRDLQGDGAQGL